MIRTVARFAAVTATSVTMLALLPAAASANVTFHAGSIQYANKAQLQEDGTALMTFTYQCVPGFEGFPEAESGRLEVRVQQPEAFGFAFAPESQVSLFVGRHGTTTEIYDEEWDQLL